MQLLFSSQLEDPAPKKVTFLSCILNLSFLSFYWLFLFSIQSNGKEERRRGEWVGKKNRKGEGEGEKPVRSSNRK
jgi:hypothetical protein